MNNKEINNIFNNIITKYSKIDEPYKNDLSLEDKEIRARQSQNNQRAFALASTDNELQKLNDLLITIQNGGDEDDCKP